jgi:NAD(P)H-hydrate repair Nnr-like enzyme with NAD(P)H-hydrate dehydratase domain
MTDAQENSDEQQQPEEFLNRAARRAAKSKKHAHGEVLAQGGSQPHGRGNVTARKDYGNRRSG